MPCEFSAVTLRNWNRAKNRQRNKVLEKKKAIFVALNTMGFDVSFEEKNEGRQTFILGKEKDNV